MTLLVYIQQFKLDRIHSKKRSLVTFAVHSGSLLIAINLFERGGYEGLVHFLYEVRENL